MRYKDNWIETQKRFESWWRRDKMDRPLLRIISQRKIPIDALEIIQPATNAMEYHLNAERKLKVLRNYCKTHEFLAEAFPYADLNLGPGSLATYLGSEPYFSIDTVWYTECIHDWAQYGGLKYDPENAWWKYHLSVIETARKYSNGEFILTIPDIIENIDIISAMRGPQNTCYDLIDEPDMIKSCIRQVNDLYFKFYDQMYDLVKLEDGSSCYTDFSIWGKGKTAKVQCDFSALMSPSQFREFVLPSLTEQCKQLDNTLYHLDGPDAIRHLEAIMEIEDLDALQWVPGAGKADGGSEQWYPIYEKVREAGKSLWIGLRDGNVDDWIRNADKIVKTFGNQHLYFLFPEMNESDAQKLLATADEKWR